MKINFKYALLAVLVGVTALVAEARSYTSETLNYEIVYHWGAVWKHAGDAKLSISKSGDGYQSTLVGKTRSWADKVYPVRDTLKSKMKSNFAPLRYEKHTHENNHYGMDVVNFSYNYGNTSATCKRYRKNKPVKTISLSAKCQAYDMVSVFYMLRDIDYNALATNKSITTVIFSGKQKEYLTIRYKGVENAKMRNGSQRQAYHITFKFTQEGGKKSSDDINCWMSTDASRIPLLIVGKLPVGEVKCYYAG